MTDMDVQLINPPELGEHIGYSNGVMVPPGARLLFVAGQVAWDREHHLVGGDNFAQQFGQALRNVAAIVSAAGGRPEHVVELTIFVTDKQRYLSDLRGVGDAYRAVFGRHFPAMALVEIKGLIEPGALVEIRGVAAIAS